MKSKRYALCVASLLVAAAAPAFAAEPNGSGGPVPLIFDTDLGNDCDDVLAMGVIHSLQSRGECELLAVTITKDQELAAPFADVVNTFYGRGDIPIGVCNSGVTDDKGKYNVLAEQPQKYPHDLRSGKNAPDAVTVLRKSLASQKDGSVVIAQVGFFTNLCNLLASKPDDISPLSGEELVSKKVRLLSVMAGAFTQDHKEYNVVQDIPSAQTLCRDWPTPIVWSGYEIGTSLVYPHQSILRDYNYAEYHPLAEAYKLYSPPPHDRPTWDLTSVLHAIRPDRGYFDLSPRGRVSIADDGLTTFEEDQSGRDQFMIIRDEQKGRTTEALVQLSSQPPISQ